MSDREAYFAGLMDGEGSWSIQIMRRDKTSFNPRMTMTLKYGGSVLYEMAEEFGGSVYVSKDGMYRWSLGGREAMRLTTTRLLPHLRVKKQIAEQFLQALDQWPRYQGGGKAVWTVAHVSAITAIALSLNVHRSEEL